MLSVINSTYETWKELHFADLQKYLEDTVLKLAINRESGDDAKKALVKFTVEYRKTATEEVRKSVQGILKRYQSEIDTWRQRTAFAEDAFISIYKKLMDLPDPTISLAEVNAVSKRAERATELECDARRFRETVDELRNEINLLKQYECENKRLKKFADDVEDNMQAQLQAEVNRLQLVSKQMEEKNEESLFILRSEADGKVAALEQKCLGLSQALQLSQSDAFNLKTRVDHLESGRSSEVELLTEELDKANAQLFLLQSEVAVSSPKDTHPEDSAEIRSQLMATNTRIEELEQILLQRTDEIHSLTTTIHELRTLLRDQQNESYSSVSQLNNERASLQKQLSEANQKLAAQADYSEVCRELAMLRSVEFPEKQHEDEEEPGSAADSVDVARQPLEVLLVKRNKTLVNQLVELNAVNESLKADVDRLKVNKEEYRSQVTEKDGLIQRLESDLYCVERLVQHGDNHWRASTSLDAHRHDEGRVLSEAIDGEQTGVHQTDSTEQVDASLFRIVQHQRDRLKLRSDELEQSCAHLRQQAGSLQREVQQVRADNVKLYEKIRFLQSYSYSPATQRPPNTVVSTTASVNGNVTRYKSQAGTDSQDAASVLVPVDSDATVVKYSQAYADHLDPFNQFSRKERQRTYQGLPPHEKVILRLGRVIVGDRRARLAAFVYVIVIHLLIFLAIYKAAYFQNTAIEAESSCAARYAEHMRAVHSIQSAGNHPP